MNIVAFSGGKDSTAMALRMAELGEDFSCLFTPAGNEPQELFAHIDSVMAYIKKPLILPENKTLEFWMAEYNALPSWRMRWCTRQIKILPCIAYLKAHPGSVLCVGLRADEEERKGLYGEYATYRYPLREWNWNEKAVKAYLRTLGVKVPPRTNCDWCYDQRIGEWFELWHTRPERFQEAVVWEERTEHTFRSPQKDTWPIALKDLRKKFEAGHVPPGVKTQWDLFEDSEQKACRVCSL